MNPLLVKLHALFLSLSTSQRLALVLGSASALVFLMQQYKSAKVSKLIPDHASVHEEEFDVVIVGGGTSGCALAARISEDPRIRVLLLESGGSGQALRFSRIPSAFGRLFNTEHIYRFYTEPQTYAQGQSRFWPRAKMLGGCSSMNAQMAQYGAPEDYDEWAKVIGDESWSWKSFSKYFRKMENYIPNPEYPLVDATARGTGGPVRVGYFNYVSNSSKAFIQSCINLGIPFTRDFNGPQGTLGVSRIMTYVDQNYKRVSSETAYLTPDVLARKNLKVITHAQATRVLFGDSNQTTRAVGVEFAESSSSPRYIVRAKKEVVLCAGALHSPHLLMLSGIGPKEHLAKYDIPTIVNLPGVGSHLTDHPVVDTYYKDKSLESLYYLAGRSFGQVMRAFKAIFHYRVIGGGPLAANLGESAAFVRSDDPKLFPKDQFSNAARDSTSSPNSPDLEIFTTPMAYKEHGSIVFPLPTYALHVYLLRPTSTGEVLLKSNNPFDLPSVNPNYLKTPEDQEKLFRGTKLCLQIARAEPLASRLDQEDVDIDFDHQRHLTSDDEIRQLVKQRVETVYHPTSTCRMAPQAENGVVDSRLRVYGVDGLRVCDASFFPYTVSGHTAGACFAAAEKLADIIKGEFV